MLIILPPFELLALSLSGTWVTRAVMGLGFSGVGCTSGSWGVLKKGIRLRRRVSESRAVCSEEFHHAPSEVRREEGIALAAAISAWMTSPGGTPSFPLTLPSVPPGCTVADESVETTDSRREETLEDSAVPVEVGSWECLKIVMVERERGSGDEVDEV